MRQEKLRKIFQKDKKWYQGLNRRKSIAVFRIHPGKQNFNNSRKLILRRII